MVAISCSPMTLNLQWLSAVASSTQFTKSPPHVIGCKNPLELPHQRHPKEISSLTIYCEDCINFAEESEKCVCDKTPNGSWFHRLKLTRRDWWYIKGFKALSLMGTLTLLEACKQLHWEFVYLLSNTETQLISCFCNFAATFICMSVVWSITILDTIKASKRCFLSQMVKIGST